MKKRFIMFLLLSMFAAPSFAADQWDKAAPTGAEDAGTIDNIMRVNQAAQDRLLNGYRRGLGVNKASASALSILTGEIAIPNAAVSIVKYRETTAATPVGWSDIDTGAEESATQYYVYATADTDITGMVFKVSKSSSLPSGSTFYVKIGQFYNNSSGDIQEVISYRPDNGTDYQDVVKAWVRFDGSGTVAISDSYNVSSITDNGTGNYTVNFSTAFANDDYAVVGGCQQTSTSGNATCILSVDDVSSNPATGSVRINTDNTAGSEIDSYVYLIAIGDRV